MKIADSVPDESVVLAEASEMISTCMAGIHEFWRKHLEPSNRRGQPGSRGRPH